jgi:antitoxin component of MazEF toxin-antitoxin module
VEAAKLREGDRLELVVPGPGKVELKTAKANLSLAQLVRKITPQNRHNETDWGKPVGGELW